MSTFESLTEKKIRIDASVSTGEEHLDSIIKSFGDCGNAEIEFLPLSDEHIKKAMDTLGKEKEEAYDEYVIFTDDTVKICYSSEISKIYALYEIKKHYDGGINCGVIYGGAIAPFRGHKSYLPPKEGIEDFKRFIDLLLYLGYNKLTLELGGGAEYKSHPEINEGWCEICDIFSEYCGKTMDVQRMYKFPKNSIHVEIAGGRYLTEEEMGEIINYCRVRHMEIIPEMPCLSHADYLLYKHPEFAEDKEDLFPDVACPSNEDYYKMLFDIFDDVIRVFQPKRINIGHDELYVLGLCDKCKGKSAAELVGGDILKIHDYLKSKGVKTLLWGDKIAKAWHGGNAAVHVKCPVEGKKFTFKGREMVARPFKCHSMEQFMKYIKENPHFEGWYVEEAHQSADMLPEGLEVFNWSFGEGEKIEDEYRERGFISMYGNWAPHRFKGLKKRLKKDKIEGASISNWGATDMVAMQRTETLFKLFFGEKVFWHGDYDEEKRGDYIPEVSRKLFEYVNRDILHRGYAQINHSCDFDIFHESFDCGYWIEREKFHIGDYEIEFDDGEKMIYPIIWGENIGQGSVHDGCTDASFSGPNLNILEPCGISLPFYKENGEVFYKILIPTEKKIKNIILTKTDKCTGNIKFEY